MPNNQHKANKNRIQETPNKSSYSSVHFFPHPLLLLLHLFPKLLLCEYICLVYKLANFDLLPDYAKPIFYFPHFTITIHLPPQQKNGTFCELSLLSTACYLTREGGGCWLWMAANNSIRTQFISHNTRTVKRNDPHTIPRPPLPIYIFICFFRYSSTRYYLSAHSVSQSKLSVSLQLKNHWISKYNTNVVSPRNDL